MVDRGGVPASTFQSINASLHHPARPGLLATLWTFLGRKGLEPSSPLKFGMGVVQVGLGFLVLVWGANSVGMDAAVPVVFIFLIYLLHTTGELCLSPVGLSAMNRLAPAHNGIADYGHLVFRIGHRQLRSRLDCGGHRRRKCRVRLQARNWCWTSIPRSAGFAIAIGVGVMVRQPAHQEADASRHAQGTMTSPAMPELGRGPGGGYPVRRPVLPSNQHLT